MKRITILLLFVGLFTQAQDKCNFYCHNGTVVKAINDNATKGHEKHGDIFLGTCETFTGVVGGACNVLTAKEFDFSAKLPIGKKYVIINAIGQQIQKGRVTDSFLKELPKDELLFIKINGYKLKKIIKN